MCHASFRDTAFVDLLRAHGVALVVADSAGTWPRFEEVTAGFRHGLGSDVVAVIR